MSSVSFAGSCLLLAVLATHGVEETAWDVIDVPEVVVAKEIVGVNDKIRADISLLPMEHMVARVAVARLVFSPDHRRNV